MLPGYEMVGGISPFKKMNVPGQSSKSCDTLSHCGHVDGSQGSRVYMCVEGLIKGFKNIERKSQ